MEYQITIAEPCHENWSAMQPADNGRHCDQCCKTVVDFTDWSVDEIAAYLFASRNQSVCGRFTEDQLAQHYPTPETYIYQLQHSGLSFLKRVAALILFVFCLDNSPANAQNTNKKPATTQQARVKGEVQQVVMGKPATPTQPVVKAVDTTTAAPPMILGMIALPQNTDTVKPIKSKRSASHTKK